MELRLIQSKDNEIFKRSDTGVILHLYYPEIWKDLLPYLLNLGKKFDLFVTIPYGVDISEDTIKDIFPDAQIYRCENRGRDVSPFLVVFSAIAKLGYKYLCKVHANKSTHIASGIEWQQDMMRKLLGSRKIISRIKKAFDEHPDWGLIAPQGHVMPNNFYWEQNATNVIKLAHSVGIPTDHLEFSFVADSMFWFRPQAFDLLLETDALTQDFELEQGKQFGTLANAYEYFFGMAANHAGYKIAECDLQEVRLPDISLQFRLLIQACNNQEQILTAQVAKKHHLVQELTAQVDEKENAITHYKNILWEKEKLIRNLEIVIDSIYGSTSWKISRPLRDAKTLAKNIYMLLYSILRRIGKIIYLAIPGSLEKKQQFKEMAFRRFRFLSLIQPGNAMPLPAHQINDFLQSKASNDAPDTEGKRRPSFSPGRVADRRKISVIITSYNHERYINQCIESILDQKGNFNLEIILGDDSSLDNTSEILQQYSKKYPDIFKMMPKQDNMGVTKNLKRCLDACQGDYIAICEGDDYWTDDWKLAKQMQFLEDHNDYSMCFSSFVIFYENENRFSPFTDPLLLNKDTFTTEDLIPNNYIGNFSCCMYRTDVVRKLPGDIFKAFTVDWMFNMACGEIGKIGFIRDSMSVYRKHSDGLWSGKSVAEQVEKLQSLIVIYDKLLNYKYHDRFEKYRMDINSVYSQNDLLILDTLFPLPLSPFRYQEFISYLDHFPLSKVLTTGEHFFALKERRSVREVIEEFEKVHPDYRGRTIASSHDIEPYKARLAYAVFLNNIKVFLDSLEKNRIPFIFTLYPGGGFELNKSESDHTLLKIFRSPQFRKVIVTQEITYDYLISKKFCNPDQIEFIFGVVTPLELIKPYYGKKHFGFEKDRLDICFVSHKYMPRGVDKGYDVFIEVARKLAKIHNNIEFHVVGSFTEKDIPITGLDGRITFYGVQEKDWFDRFYMDKDIILSPNIPFTLAKGAFDGFPTSSCVEAGLRNVAILCTDILKQNSKFTDAEEIIIIPHDSDKIVEVINALYSNPEKLKKIAENGSIKIRELYSHESQISPRIKILEWGLAKKTIESPIGH